MEPTFDVTRAKDHAYRVEYMQDVVARSDRRYRLRQHETHLDQYSVLNLVELHSAASTTTSNSRRIVTACAAKLQESPDTEWSSVPSTHGRKLFCTLRLFDLHVLPKIRGGIAKLIRDHMENEAQADSPGPAAVTEERAAEEDVDVDVAVEAGPAGGALAFDETRGCDLAYRVEWCQRKIAESRGKYKLRSRPGHPTLYNAADLTFLHGNYVTPEMARDAVTSFTLPGTNRDHHAFASADREDVDDRPFATASANEYAWVNVKNGRALYCSLAMFDEHILPHIRGGIAPIVRRCKAAAGTLVEIGSPAAIDLTLRNAANIQDLVDEVPAVAETIVAHQQHVEETLAPVVGVQAPQQALVDQSEGPLTIFVDPSDGPSKALVEGGHATADEVERLHVLYFWLDPGNKTVKFGISKAGNVGDRDDHYRTAHPGLVRQCNLFSVCFTTVKEAEKNLKQLTRDRRVNVYARSHEWIPERMMSEYIQRAIQDVQPKYVVMTKGASPTRAGLSEDEYQAVQREINAQGLHLELEERKARLEQSLREDDAASKARTAEINARTAEINARTAEINARTAEIDMKSKVISSLYEKLMNTGDMAILDVICKLKDA